MSQAPKRLGFLAMRKSIFIVSAIIFVLAFSVFFLSQRNSNRYCLWQPNLRKTFNVYPGIMPGVSGNGRFYTNSYGIRADEFTRWQRYRVLTLGGSTTECLYIDQQKSWPYILQKELNNYYVFPVWVGNIGKSGLSTKGNLLELRYLLPEYPKVDLIIALVGFNDFQIELGGIRLANERKSKEEQEDIVFAVYPGKKRRTVQELIKELLSGVRPDKSGIIEDEAGKWYLGARGGRRNARQILDELPDLSSALIQYEKNLNSIIDIAKNGSSRIIFLTQPFIWHKGLTEAEQQLLWCGFSNQEGVYYSLDALNRGMVAFNQKLMEVCEKRGIECIDVERMLPKNSSVFYDDVHFNESGCELIAAILYDYLIKHPSIEGSY
ncbi:MAG: hypothetical protein AMJ95_03310 [Omnitrophica WOR_2 bacterium SM23_72]|nr:MAG: hypothetical protein AMJ95_03310 [Omnitrophica WOR_2 bacterium SM23_72]